MEEGQFVSREEYRHGLAAQFAITQQLLTLLSAISTILHEKGIVTADRFEQLVSESAMNKHRQKIEEAVRALRGERSILEILKDFEGPPQ